IILRNADSFSPPALNVRSLRFEDDLSTRARSRQLTDNCLGFTDRLFRNEPHRKFTDIAGGPGKIPLRRQSGDEVEGSGTVCAEIGQPDFKLKTVLAHSLSVTFDAAVGAVNLCAFLSQA